MRAVFVVVDDVVGQDGFQMAAAQNQHPVEALASDGADEAFGEGVEPGARTGVRMVLMPSDPKTSSKLEVNLASRSRIQDWTGWGRSASTMLRFRACWVTHVPVGLAVTPATLDPAGVELDEEEHVEALQQHCVHREEIAGQPGRCLSGDELGPSGTCPHRRRIDAVATKDPPDARRSKDDTQPGQRTLDPAIAPNGIFPGQLQDDRNRAGGMLGRPGRWA